MPLRKRDGGILAVAVAVITSLCGTEVQAQAANDDPCGGSLSILDRPTVGDSACVVPERQAVLELGVQRVKYRDGSRGPNLPEAEIRFGIPGNNELVLLPPNYTRQTTGYVTISGPGATIVGMKHELGYGGNWLAAVESLVIVPSGNAAFGSRGTGVAFNGIVSYAPTNNTSLSMMLGVSRQTLSRLAGGGRYSSHAKLT